MKVAIIVTDDAGNTWQFELPAVEPAKPSIEVAPPRGKKPTRKKPSKAGTVAKDGVGALQQAEPALDLSLPVRPFMNRHGRTASGAKKFALLVAHSAKGDPAIEVPRSEIEKQWSKMTGLLGEFNPAFSTRAKDKGWVDSPKFGVYKLLPGWNDGVD